MCQMSLLVFVFLFFYFPTSVSLQTVEVGKLLLESFLNCAKKNLFFLFYTVSVHFKLVQ